MRPFHSITKAQLLDAIEFIPDDALVCFSSDYGDIGHTKQVHSLQGYAEERRIEKSAYSHSDFALVEDDDEDSDDEKVQRVWVIF
jgi:hypothetical protein